MILLYYLKYSIIYKIKLINLKLSKYLNENFIMIELQLKNIKFNIILEIIYLLPLFRNN
jgi:hypothetical protein